MLSACETSSTSRTISSNSGSRITSSGDFDKAKAAKIRLSGGLQYLRAGQLKNAKRFFDKAVEYGEDSGSLHHALAIYFEQVKELSKANESYKKALRREPKKPIFLSSYATFLCKQKDFQKADKYFQKAINTPIYPEIALAYLNAGVCAKFNNQFKIASEYFRKALNRNSNLTQALLEMAKLQFRDENYERSSAYLKRFETLVKYPRPDAIWLGLRVAYFQKDRDAKASYANKLEQLFPDSDEAVEYLDNRNQWM